jgi:endonuclease/exonuclease/phosphatase family metal-dependent hydrolase
LTRLTPPSSTGGHPLRIATWNIASCRRGLGRVLDQVRRLDADLVAFQEVDRGTRRSGRIDQAAVIARAAGYPHSHFFRATTLSDGDYGLALASRHPLSGFRVGILPTLLGLEPRILASAIVDLPDAQLAVHVTHLCQVTTRWQLRADQIKRIVAQLTPASLPTLLFGDFNDRPGSKVHREVTRHFVDVFEAVGRGPASTYPLPLLRDLRLDYIFASSDVMLEQAQVVKTRASDHHAVCAMVRIPSDARGGLLTMAL